MEKQQVSQELKRLLSIDECCTYIGLGKTKTRSFMKEIGAEKKIGSRCVYDKKIIDHYLDSLHQN